MTNMLYDKDINSPEAHEEVMKRARVKMTQTPKSKAMNKLDEFQGVGHFIDEELTAINQALDIALSEAEKQGYEKAIDEFSNELVSFFNSNEAKEELIINIKPFIIGAVEKARQEGAEQKVKEIFDDIDIKQWRYFQVKDIIERVRSIEQKHLKEVKK